MTDELEPYVCEIFDDGAEIPEAWLDYVLVCEHCNKDLPDLHWVVPHWFHTAANFSVLIEARVCSADCVTAFKKSKMN